MIIIFLGSIIIALFHPLLQKKRIVLMPKTSVDRLKTLLNDSPGIVKTIIETRNKPIRTKNLKLKLYQSLWKEYRTVVLLQDVMFSIRNCLMEIAELDDCDWLWYVFHRQSEEPVQQLKEFDRTLEAWQNDLHFRDRLTKTDIISEYDVVISSRYGRDTEDEHLWPDDDSLLLTIEGHNLHPKSDPFSGESLLPEDAPLLDYCNEQPFCSGALTKYLLFLLNDFQSQPGFESWRWNYYAKDALYLSPYEHGHTYEERFNISPFHKIWTDFFFKSSTIIDIPKSSVWVVSGLPSSGYRLHHLFGKDVEKLHEIKRACTQCTINSAAYALGLSAHRQCSQCRFPCLILSSLANLPRTPMQFLTTYLCLSLDCDTPILEAIFFNASPEQDISTKFVYGILPEQTFVNPELDQHTFVSVSNV